MSLDYSGRDATSNNTFSFIIINNSSSCIKFTAANNNTIYIYPKKSLNIYDTVKEMDNFLDPCCLQIFEIYNFTEHSIFGKSKFYIYSLSLKDIYNRKNLSKIEYNENIYTNEKIKYNLNEYEWRSGKANYQTFYMHSEKGISKIGTLDLIYRDKASMEGHQWFSKLVMIISDYGDIYDDKNPIFLMKSISSESIEEIISRKWE